MLQQLHEMLKECKTLAFTLSIDSADDTKIKVVLAPQHPNSTKYPALNQPTMYSGTPAELEAEMPQSLCELTTVYVDASKAIQTAIQELEKAKKTAQKTPTKAPAATKTSSGAVAPTKGGGTSTPGATPAASPAALKKDEPVSLSLFDGIANLDGASSSDTDEASDSAPQDVPSEGTEEAAPALQTMEADDASEASATDADSQMFKPI